MKFIEVRGTYTHGVPLHEKNHPTQKSTSPDLKKDITASHDWSGTWQINGGFHKVEDMDHFRLSERGALFRFSLNWPSSSSSTILLSVLRFAGRSGFVGTEEGSLELGKRPISLASTLTSVWFQSDECHQALQLLSLKAARNTSSCVWGFSP